MSSHYANAGFDFDVWSVREMLTADTVSTLHREKLTTYESLSRLEEGDIKDLGLAIGERAVLRAAVKSLTVRSTTSLSVMRPPTPVRRLAPSAPMPGRGSPAPRSPSAYGAPPGSISASVEPDYETIPYDRPGSIVPNESFLGNWSQSTTPGSTPDGYSRLGGEPEPYYVNYTHAESDYCTATGAGVGAKAKRRAPPPPPSATTATAAPSSPLTSRTKVRSAPPPPGSPSNRPSSGGTSSRTSSYVTLSKVATPPGMDKCACLDEPTFKKEIQYGYLTRADVNSLLNAHDALHPKFDIYDKPDGSPELRLCLLGTVPVMYKCEQYRVPVRIWVDKAHPYMAPVVHVTPSADMTLNPTAYVNEKGVVSVGYLKRWKHPASELLGLVEAMTKSFSQATPVYAKLPQRS